MHPFGLDANAARPAADYAFVPHIRLIDVDEATGPLAEEYAAAMGRAGKVFNIVKSMSLNPSVLKRSMDLYKDIMFGPSELSRVERELLGRAADQSREGQDRACGGEEDREVRAARDLEDDREGNQDQEPVERGRQ